MTQLPISLDPDRYLDGPLSSPSDAFASGDWQDWQQDGEEPPPNTAALRSHGQVLASLGLIYLRHGDPARAMVLGLAAMAMDELSPATILLVAEAMLGAGDPEQALAVLTRFDRAGGMSAEPNPAERGARHYITARILFRRGETDAARTELQHAQDAARSGDQSR